MSKRDRLNMPFDFVSDSVLGRFAFMSGQPLSFALGQIILLGSAVARHNKVKFSPSEIDAIVSWGEPSHFYSLLEQVGWATYKRSKDQVTLMLPEAVQGLNNRAVAGQARARSAIRDGKGRYINTKAERSERYPVRDVVRVNADGIVIE